MAGQVQDDETGLYYLRARYYDPGTGRFGQRDLWNRPVGGTHGYGKFAHLAVLSAPRILAPIFRASTVKVMSSAPLQANCCHPIIGPVH